MAFPFLDPKLSFEDNAQTGPINSLNIGSSKKLSLNYELFGHKLETPFGIAAGPLPTAKFIDRAFSLGYSVATYKTVRSRKLIAHSWPNMLPVNINEQLPAQNTPETVTVKENFTDPVTITNSFGVPSVTPDFWQEDMKKAVTTTPSGSIVIGSFQGSSDESGNFQKYVQDFALTAKLVQETGCKVLEVNLSCPNEGKQNLLCFDIENSKIVVEAIKNQIGNLPLIVKTGFYRDQNILENFVKTIGPIVEGIESINAVSCKILKDNGQSAWEDPKRLYSGVCGWGIKDCGINTVKKFAELKKQLDLKYTILGVGGIMKAEDFMEYLEAGASVALSATGAMWDENLAINARTLI